MFDTTRISLSAFSNGLPRSILMAKVSVPIVISLSGCVNTRGKITNYRSSLAVGAFWRDAAVASARAYHLITRSSSTESTTMVSSTHAVAIEEATIADIHAAYRAGTLTVHAVTAAYLARIAAYDKNGPYINSLITVNARALEEADALDAAYRASGTSLGPLHGIPVIVKDNLDAVGMPMTSGF